MPFRQSHATRLSAHAVPAPAWKWGALECQNCGRAGQNAQCVGVGGVGMKLEEGRRVLLNRGGMAGGRDGIHASTAVTPMKDRCGGVERDTAHIKSPMSTNSHFSLPNKHYPFFFWVVGWVSHRRAPSQQHPCATTSRPTQMPGHHTS